MKKTIYGIVGALMGAVAVSACTDLDEKVFDRIDATIYYQDENSVKGAIASIYNSATSSFLEYFWYLNEFSADQISWRVWNGGMWGWDEAEKYVLSSHTWNSESKIIRQAWSGAWRTIGLCNQLLYDLERIPAADMGMSEDAKLMYMAEVRTIRAWSFYNNFELWGGSLPICAEVTSEVPGSADANFAVGCQKVYDFIATELDECYGSLMVENGSGATRNRINMATNRMLKMRLLLNSELFTGTPRYSECSTLCQQILNGEFGSYSLANDYRELYEITNNQCPEVVFAFALENGQLTNNNSNTTFLPYNYGDMFGCDMPLSGWNCVIVAPSKDNSVDLNTNPTGTPRSFITDYHHKLGAVIDRMNPNDRRRQPMKYDPAQGRWNGGMFAMGAQYDYATGAPIPADADRENQNLVYVDQLGTFLGNGRALEDVMSPRWGETNSGYRLVKYPIYPTEVGIDWTSIDAVEFRLAEVYYTLAECKLRSGSVSDARDLVKAVKGRYFANAADIETLPAADWNYDYDWMLSEWGIEFLNESRRRRTDLRRFDKFTQGQWWFFGEATEADRDLPAKRDRRYEWFPIPQTALMVNPGLVQVPGY